MEPAEYAGFLTTLFHQVAGGQPPDLYFWRPADEVVYGGYVLEDDLTTRSAAVHQWDRFGIELCGNQNFTAHSC